MIEVTVNASNHLIAAGLSSILEQESDIVLAPDTDGDRSSQVIVAYLADLDGWGSEKQLSSSAAGKLVVLIIRDSDAHSAVRLIAEGVSGVLVGTESALLPLAVRAVANGGSFYSPAVGKTVAAHLEAKAGPVVPAAAWGLTKQEHRILGELGDGLSNEEIAGALNVSVSTVKFHVSSILRKLGARNRVQAVAQVHRSGLAGRRSTLADWPG